MSTWAILGHLIPDKPDYSWTRVTKDIPRLIKSFIDFRYCRDWTNPEAKADRLAREKQKNDNLLNAARLYTHMGADTLCEALHGTIKVNPDGTWYRPQVGTAGRSGPENLAHALAPNPAPSPTEPNRPSAEASVNVDPSAEASAKV